MEFRLPEITSASKSVVVTAWHALEKETVLMDQDIVEVSTDKATFDIPAPAAGLLVKIIKKPGDEARAGDVLAMIE